MKYGFLVLLFPCMLYAQQSNIQLMPFTTSDIPAGHFEGKIIQARHWKDKKGEHIVLLNETGLYDSKKEEGSRSAKLFAYHFIKVDTGWKQVWKLYDSVEDCAVDVFCAFFKNSLTLTDIDNNNETEICFLYHLSCRGDISPDDKKLIMYEGTNKYAIPGNMRVQYGKDKYGGKKIIDKTFSTGSAVLLDYANKQWKKFDGLKD